MLFNSYVFVLLFLPLTLVGYYILNRFGLYRLAMCELVVMSFIFYVYNNVSYLAILLVSILINWFLSRLLCKFIDKDKIKKIVLSVGIFINVGIIFYFKYFNFFLENINKFIQADFNLYNIVLPLGISFFTFQQISYLIDSYKKETINYTFIEYVTFVVFFPQLVAGPIVLHNEIIPQFQNFEKKRFDYNNLAEGIYIFAIGMFKKVLIADTFGNAVTWGWENIDTMNSIEIIIVMLSYTFQIYFDFSGYCDMAIGIGKMFNIDFPVNFNSPYKSYSIVGFWKRWHITLTRFLRNYIYFPLGGSRKGEVHTCFNIMIVFIISGLWHGANWTFILWGALHGIAQVLTRLFDKKWEALNKAFQWMCTFLFINLTWLIFRADSIGQAMFLIKRIFIMNITSISDGLYNCFRLLEVDATVRHVPMISGIIDKISGFYMWVVLVGAMIICLNCKNVHEEKFRPTIIKSIMTAMLLVWSIVSFSGVSTFLYFNF